MHRTEQAFALPHEFVVKSIGGRRGALRVQCSRQLTTDVKAKRVVGAKRLLRRRQQREKLLLRRGRIVQCKLYLAQKVGRRERFRVIIATRFFAVGLEISLIYELRVL